LRLYDPDSTSLRAGLEVSLRGPDGADRGKYEVERVAPKPGSPLVRLWLAGVGSREAADALSGLELSVRREDLGDLDEDEFYLADMIGHRVERRQAGEDGEFQALGIVVGITSNGAQDLFEIAYGDPGSSGRPRTWLLPILPQFLVEVGDARILVDLPEGMLPTSLESS
jgi:16S rRNA processing protein RimM